MPEARGDRPSPSSAHLSASGILQDGCHQCGVNVAAAEDDANASLGLNSAAQQGRQPWRLLWELINPPGKTLGYLAAQWLPLMFVPAISFDAWLLVALPLAGLLLARGSNDPLAINIRYALLVAPGLFAGAVYLLPTVRQIKTLPEFPDELKTS